MCTKRIPPSSPEEENNVVSNDSDTSDSSFSDSDVSMTDSEEDVESEADRVEDKIENEPGTSGTGTGTAEEAADEEEEDEVVRAIRRESERKSNHPPPITCEYFVTDISFHPNEDILAVATIVGDVMLYRYSNEENTIVKTLELHTKACRDIEFSQDGKILFSVSKDKSIMISDVESGNLVRFYENSHEAPVYCLSVIDEHIFATGDDDGEIKLWDMRQKNDTQIFKTKKNEDYISDIITNEARKYLICSSGDGSLTTIDMHNRRVFLQSEEYDEELTCLGLFRTETKVLAGSSKGKLYLYNWNEFGLHSDAYPGPKSGINDMIPITENIVVTAYDDGVLMATHLFPHKHLGVVGQHSLSVENVDICNNGQFIASSSHNNDIKFWNIEYFETFDKISKKPKKNQRKKDMEHNLPSSKMKNASDFFSDLC